MRRGLAPRPWASSLKGIRRRSAGNAREKAERCAARGRLATSPAARPSPELAGPTPLVQHQRLGACARRDAAASDWAQAPKARRAAPPGRRRDASTPLRPQPAAAGGPRVRRPLRHPLHDRRRETLPWSSSRAAARGSGPGPPGAPSPASTRPSSCTSATWCRSSRAVPTTTAPWARPSTRSAPPGCGNAAVFAAGNHDIGDRPDPTMPTGEATEESLGTWEERHGPSWRSWSAAGVRFLVLNSQLFNTGLESAARQRAWFEAQLAAAGSEPCVLFLHMPPYLGDPGEPWLGPLRQPRRAGPRLAPRSGAPAPGARHVRRTRALPVLRSRRRRGRPLPLLRHTLPVVHQARVLAPLHLGPASGAGPGRRGEAGVLPVPDGRRPRRRTPRAHGGAGGRRRRVLPDHSAAGRVRETGPGTDLASAPVSPCATPWPPGPTCPWPGRR